MKINEYPEVETLKDDDYLLVNSETDGTKRISGKKNMIKVKTHLFKNVSVNKLATGNILYNTIDSFENIGIPSDSKIVNLTMGSWGSVTGTDGEYDVSGCIFSIFLSEDQKNIAIISNKSVIIGYLYVNICYI